MIGVFFVFAVVAVAGALGVVAARTPVHGVLALLVNFVGLGALFLTLEAEFLAVSQIIVYAGAVLVLFLFVISLLTARAQPVEGPRDRLAYQGSLAMAAAAALLGVLLAAAGRTLQVPAGPAPAGGPGAGAAGLLPAAAAGLPRGFGSVQAFGRALLRQYPYELELVGLVLLVACVGVMVLVGRRAVQLAHPAAARAAGAGEAADDGRPASAPPQARHRPEPEPAGVAAGGRAAGGGRA
ncbi:MAG TPA: NADH-quinone oxidoreductase subunit J [Limnochordales bacterium]